MSYGQCSSWLGNWHNCSIHFTFFSWKSWVLKEVLFFLMSVKVLMWLLLFKPLKQWIRLELQWHSEPLHSFLHLLHQEIIDPFVNWRVKEKGKTDHTGIKNGKKKLRAMKGTDTKLIRNRPFPNYVWPLLKGDSWCSSFHMTIGFFLHVNNFHLNGWVPGLALETRPKVIRK